MDIVKIPSPCYVLEERRLRDNLHIIANVASQSAAEIILAFKGFAMWSAFPVVREYIHNTAASSVNEARLAFEEMGCKAHTYSPAYSDDNINEIIKYSSHVTFNSLSQYKKFRYNAIENDVSIGLRVNPVYSPVKTLLYNPASPGSRLGVVPEELGESLPEEVEGLHFHVLCENDAEDLQEVLKHFESRYSKYFAQIKWVNFGGGHLMTREGYNVQLLIQILQDFIKRTGLKVILEPGSAFAWQTGCLVSTVLDVIERDNIKTAILDVSFTAHMPDCLEMPYQPVVTGAQHGSKGHCVYRLGGSSCLAGDYIGDWSFDKPLHIGDKIVFEDMIHYTMVKTTFFNGVDHPSIGIWKPDNTFQLVKKFTYADYKEKLS